MNTPRELDPQVSYGEYDYNILQNVYETLLWYNGANGNQTIPWLAANYTLSADGKTANFTLRSGIKFADGESLNSTAVYFSLNKLLIEDNAAPTSFGTQGSWILQQLLEHESELRLQSESRVQPDLGTGRTRPELCADNRAADFHACTS